MFSVMADVHGFLQEIAIESELYLVILIFYELGFEMARRSGSETFALSTKSNAEISGTT